jgi:NAD(P)-dependent dehydrogenase (short-subunit alcohol dehydrogenase family)
VVITGSGSGIGLATATMALREGALVLGVDRSKLPASIPSNSKFEYLQKDLTDESTPAIVVSKCLELFGGRIDALLNIAGVMDDSGSVDTVSDATLDMCLSVNLTAPIRMMRAVIPIMRAQQNGSIVNVASKAGTSGAASGIAYTASKYELPV